MIEEKQKGETIILSKEPLWCDIEGYLCIQ